MNAIKYPKTMHLPWSPGLQNDDRVMPSIDFLTGKMVVVTEKMDGENTTLYNNRIHARSVDSRHHPSRDWVKGFWGTINYRIPKDLRICGENCYAKHSIHYTDLDSYFLGFGVWQDNVCLSWEDTLTVFESVGITPVPVIGTFKFSEEACQKISLDENKSEGYVVRLVDEFTLDEFPIAVGKYVRKGHVQTDDHWLTQPVVPNILNRVPPTQFHIDNVLRS